MPLPPRPGVRLVAPAQSVPNCHHSTGGAIVALSAMLVRRLMLACAQLRRTRRCHRGIASPGRRFVPAE
ncbi:hypothetical protein FRAAL5295 [Frankia alni ACN14a]|uniref:Uncharacterized protein n=1 Tax=Frankia alni (strain DSM 45986 / CECT 9034 / ACN14a) TaxID=326424 RepID=Q0RF23_FRAAA|nr:hypothetical protein FRAAL5295 [Frankia alni ACN14a]